jgi:broad specificity phosphatase PhoE
MSELFLVRHAQASFGEDDYDRLSVLGHQQARWLGEYFLKRNLQFDQVLCGDMVRHRETLSGISLGMGQALHEHSVHDEWNEFDFRSLIDAYLHDHPEETPSENAPVREISKILRNTLHAWAADRLSASVPETFSAFEQRIKSALSLVDGQAGAGKRILVVTSGGAISMALRQVLLTPPEVVVQMNLQTRNSSFSHLYFNSSGLQLSGFNHVPHLDHVDRSSAITYV